MKNFFLKTGLTLLCLIIGLGSAWGDTYTIDFNKGTTNGTNINGQLASSVETMCSSGADNASSITGTNCYYNAKGCGLRLAKSGGNGSLVVTFSSAIQSATVQKVIVYASAVASGNTLTVTPAGTVSTTTEFSSLKTYSTSNSASTNYQLSEISINGTLNSLTFGATSKKYVVLHRIDIITGAAKTLSSIAVKTAPTQTTYTEGENFNPAGLVITGTYSDASTEDIAYAGHESDFTFSPALTTVLTTSNTSVTITYGGKTTTQSITVNEAPKHTAYFYSNGSLYRSEQYAEGADITLPTGLSAISGKTFVGWVATEISGTQDNEPSFVTSPTMGNANVTYYAVYATQETGGTPEETLSQTLQYDTWTYSGSTTDKSSYRLFHSGSYIESAPFDLSKLSKVVVYGGTFGGGSYNSLTIGDGTNTWKSVTVTGSSQTGENVYTDGTALSGTKSLRITSNSGSNSGSGTGVRISKVEIYTLEGGTTYSGYCTTVDTSTPSITANNTLEIPAAETDGTFNVTWTGMEDVDVNLYNDVDCTEEFTGDWFIAEVNSANQNIDYLAGENTSTSPRTVYMQLFGLDSEANEYTHVVTVTQAGKQGDPEITNFIKTSPLELVVGAPDYDIRNCLNIPSDYDTSTYAITTTINGLTQKDGEYACVYPYIAFSKAGEYTVHVVAAAMPGKYAQTEGNITVTVTDPAPAITTIPALFTKATEVGGTDTDINLTLNNWVVSGVNGKNAYVTDGTNGFIIYQDSHGFTAGDVLSGTVACKVLLYNGAAEIKGLTSSTTGLTVTTGGTITPRTTTIDALENINVGSVITLENVSFDAPNLTDGENTIQPYTSLYNYPNTTFTQGTHYNVTGVYILFKSGSNIIKEILPRSTEDIEEVQAEKYAINIAPCENGTVTASLEEAAAGVEVTLTVTPATGYQLSTLTVTNATTSEAITVTSNKFNMPAAAVNVAATFEEATPSDNIFYESFDDNEGKGGNDDLWSGSIASNTLQFDNEGWDTANGSGANQCAKFGSGSKKGSATTPALKYAGDATLTFKAGAWNSSSEKTTLNISIDGDGSTNTTSVTLIKGQWTEYTITLTGLTAGSKIKFEAANASNNRFFLDEVTVTKSSITPATEYDITIASDIENGTISASKAKAEEGDDITITATPDSGYHLATLYYTIDGDETQNTIENLTFTMPASNVTIHATFAEDVKYTVTIETPTNGTLVVKHGEDVVTSGEQFAVGEVLDITATPAEGYKFRNWQAVDGSTHTFTTTFSYTMGEHNVTIKANFDPADQKYLISWNVNGTVTNQQVNAGSALEAPTMTGKTLGTREFVGWTEDALVKNDTIPTYVTLGTATKDVTYYAVFADREEVTAAVPTSITAYADGNYYIVDTYDVDGTTHYFAMDGPANSAGNIVATDITDAVTLNGNGTITIDENATCIKDAMKYNITYSDDKYLLKNLLTEKYIKKASGNKDNDLKNCTEDASYAEWINIAINDKRFGLETDNNRALFMQYSNYTNNLLEVSPRFKAYSQNNRNTQVEAGKTSGQNYSVGYTYFVPATPIALSNFATHEVSVSQYGSTTLCMPEDYVMPEGLTGKIVTAKEDLATPGYYSLTIVTKYNAGDVVPAGECLVLSGNQDSYYIAPGEASSSASVTEYPDNLLRSDYVIDTEDSKLRFKTNYEEGNASSYYYYKLTTKNSANFGWYWGVDGGAPFWMTSNERTYLVIDKEIANKVRGFALDECNEEDITTFINGLVTEEINRSGRIYNLQGQMVNKLQKGINIVNGKKVIR